MNLMEHLNQVKVTEEINNYFIDIIVHFSMVKFFVLATGFDELMIG